MNNKIEELKHYYKKVCTPLVFVNETRLENDKIAKVYLYNFSNEEELENFKKVFQEYLPFYVLNFDLIELYDLDNNISMQLKSDAKHIYENDITPNRKTEINGIFGELFNDYYIKNVMNDEILLTYLSRRDFNSGNWESQGIDIVACEEKNNKLNIILSEAKFVGTLSQARDNLKGDISGEHEHLNKDYINGYMDFVMHRQLGLDKVRSEKVQTLINEFNKKRWQEKLQFIDCINKMGHSCKFIYFAIFKQCKNRKIEDFKEAINEIINEFNNKIKETEIENYSLEVVFIPTFNTSMNLKRKMEEWD
ncbi:MAG: hypothetical protein IJE68_03015 [Clostridia bacterium]|nr:hypothetical protein [Clostridia bacterium]